MRIGINGRFLVAKQTGVQRAAYNLVTALLKLDKVNQYFIFRYNNISFTPFIFKFHASHFYIYYTNYAAIEHSYFVATQTIYV